MTVPKPKALSDDVLTLPEIAWLTGAKRGTVERWRLRNQDPALRVRAIPFPDEDDAIGSTPVWRASRILAWLNDTDRQIVHTLDEWREHKAAGGFRRRSGLI
jgi:predicted DNA-binding transcriptional regulator AlpA